jgi:hypothetical protein
LIRNICERRPVWNAAIAEWLTPLVQVWCNVAFEWNTST